MDWQWNRLEPGETKWRAWDGPGLGGWGCNKLREKQEGDVTAHRNADVAHHSWGAQLWTRFPCAILVILKLGMLLIRPREIIDSRGLTVRNSHQLLGCYSVGLWDRVLGTSLPPFVSFSFFSSFSFFFLFLKTVALIPSILSFIFKVAILLKPIRESLDSENISQNLVTFYLSFFNLHSMEFPSNDIILQKCILGETFLNLHIWEKPLQWMLSFVQMPLTCDFWRMSVSQ